MDAPKIKKQSKNKIRIEFDRAPLWERVKGKFFSMRFVKNVVFKIFRLVLLLGVSFVIIYPYISKIADSFKTFGDFQDPTVFYVSRTPTLEQYKYIIKEGRYWLALLNTFWLSASTALAQTLACALVGYGLAKFKFKGRNIIFVIVIVTMMLPQELLQEPMRNFFWRMGVDKYNPIGRALKAIGLMGDDPGWGTNSVTGLIPHYLLSITGFGFRNGLYIFLLRQFFMGVPDELEESAYMDGCTTFRTFFRIIIPLAIPMLVTVFIFAFSWQWTDDFYVETLFGEYWSQKDSLPLLNSGNFAGLVPSELWKIYNVAATWQPVGWEIYLLAVQGTTTILIALPLIIAFVFLQNKIVQGIERSGIVG